MVKVKQFCLLLLLIKFFLCLSDCFISSAAETYDSFTVIMLNYILAKSDYDMTNVFPF